MTCIPAKPSYLLSVTCIPVKTLLPGECDVTCIPAVTGYESAHCVVVFCISHSQCPLVCGLDVIQSLRMFYVSLFETSLKDQNQQTRELMSVLYVPCIYAHGK